VVDLLHRAACRQVPEIDPVEPCLLEQPDDVCLRVGVVARNEDDTTTAGFVGSEPSTSAASVFAALTTRAPTTSSATSSLDVLPLESSPAQWFVASMTI
jgi:hypothetical protein